MKPLSVEDGAVPAYGAKVVNIHEAKTHLSRLLEQVAAGHSFVIAKAGKPVARLLPLVDAKAHVPQRLGFLKGEIQIPDDFDRLEADAITALFEGKT